MDYNEYSDEELSQLIQESSEEATTILYNKYKYLIDAIIKKFLYSAQKLNLDYKDLYQEALIGFNEAIEQFDDQKKASFKTFASLCIQRKLQNAVAKAGRYKNKIMLESLSLDYVYDEYKVPLSEIISDNKENDPLENISKAEETNELLNKLKAELSDFEKDVLELFISGLDYQTIAAITGKNPKQIDNTIQRIKQKAKKMKEV